MAPFAGDTNSPQSKDCNSFFSSFHRRTLVSFVHEPQVQTTINCDDYTEEEVNACWYTCEEMSLIHYSNAKVIARMEAGKHPKKNTTYRGLEKFSKSGKDTAVLLVHACIDAVMDEQERQWKEDIVFDWGQFREMSLKVSQQSMSLAYKMAEYDEREAGNSKFSKFPKVLISGIRKTLGFSWKARYAL